MVRKLAAGAKKRGRPRKKRKGRHPGAAVPGRPQQHPLPPPVLPSRRSLRQRLPRRVEDYARFDDGDVAGGYYFEELLAEDEEAEEEDVEHDEEGEWKRRGKKFRLLQKLPNYKHHRSPDHGGSGGSPSSSSSSSDEYDGGGRIPCGKMKPSGRGGGSDGDGRGGRGDLEGEDGRTHATPGCSGTASGRTDRDCPISTPLPDKKMLEKVLDKLQKKDTYRVFAEPVDPEELPDYHEIIEHPMDFGTIRKKLLSGIYANLEEFERDICLVCANAMEYNAPDTIYFRQARCIQGLARKKFEIIRSDREDALKSEQTVQLNSVTKKAIKSSLCNAACDPGGPGSHISSAATLASTGNACTGSDAMKAGPSGEPVIIEGFVDGSFSENKGDKGEEVSAKNSPVKLERKSIMLDEDHRTTYNVSNEQPDIKSNLLLSTFENEPKHLVTVGLDAEFSYARSLARFAGALGPIAWRIASDKIEKALPAGIKFGPGWVGQYEPLPTSVLSFEGHSGHVAQFKHKSENLKERTLEGERKCMQAVATKTVELYPRASSDSSAMGVTGGKADHPKELSVHSKPVKQMPHLFMYKAGSQPSISSAMFLQHNSLAVRSAKDYSNTGVGTNISEKALLHNSSSMMGEVIDVFVQRPEQYPEIAASRSAVVVSGGNISVNSKQSELDRPESPSSCMETGGMSNGNDVDTLVGGRRPGPSLGFIPTNQMRPESDCFNHGEHVQAIGDPVKVMRVMSARNFNKIGSSGLLVADNQKLVIPTVSSPRSNSSAAASAAAQAWMLVGRSSEHSSTEASKLFKMEAGGASLGNATSQSPACASEILEDGRKRPMPSMSQLPSKAGTKELQTKCLTTFPQFILTELSRFHGQTPWRGLVPHVQNKEKKNMCPPDLNISFHYPGSPVLQSGILADSQQPDLALQL